MKYIEAVEYFEKSLKSDSIYGEAIYHHARAISNSGSKTVKAINRCIEFQKAMKYGAIVPKEVLFFYACDIKKKKY
ncbi:MAG: hypothetical protein ACOYO1_15355 [Bacteroidales bacterium]